MALTAAQTRLADTQFDYKIAEVTLAYSARGYDPDLKPLLIRHDSTGKVSKGPAVLEGSSEILGNHERLQDIGREQRFRTA
ncbi:MAG: hypothetical protein U0231_16700 [Nitrospiraceae bacterium]